MVGDLVGMEEKRMGGGLYMWIGMFLGGMGVLV